MSDAAKPVVGHTEFDPFHEHRNDPYPLFAQMREQFPVAQSQTLGGVYLVTRYEDIERIASDPRRTLPWGHCLFRLPPMCRR